MGLRSLPRLYFKGQFYWSPSTYNNNDYAPALETYSAAPAKLNWSFLREQGVQTDNEFKKWSIEPTSTGPSQPFTLPPSEWGYYGGNQCGFVTEDSPKMESINFSVPKGENRFLTHVTGFTSKHNRYDHNDKWINLPLQFNANFKPAKLVDINPEIPWSSQIFSDTFSIGSEALGQGLHAPVKYRMYSRWIYPFRNYKAQGKLIIAGGLSTLIQTVIHKADLKYFDTAPNKGSFQEQLQEKLETADGIMLRFTAYDTLYFQGKPFEGLHKKADASNSDQLTNLMVRVAVLYQKYEEELEAYKQGKISEKPKPPVNRAYSRVAGWMGAWNEGEMISTPGGRTLLPIVLPGQPEGLPVPGPVQAKGLPDSLYESGKSNVMLGPVAIEATYENPTKEGAAKGKVERLTVDLGSTMPELDYTGTKADFGEVTLMLEELGDNPKSHKIATLKNDQETYQKQAGVFDITNIPDKINDLIANSPFSLYVESYDPSTDTQTSKLGLIENPLTASCNDRGLYVNEPNPYWAPDAPDTKFTVELQYYGGPLPVGTVAGQSNVQLYMGQSYVNASQAGFGLIPDGPDVTPDQVPQPFVELWHDGRKVDNQTPLAVPIDGKLSFTLKGLQPGFPFFFFFPVAENGKFDPSTDYGLRGPATYYNYNTIRVLPFHNSLAAEFENFLQDLTFRGPENYRDMIARVNQRVYDDVFRTFHLMYPVMSFIGNPMKFQQWRGRINMLTDDDVFESAAYMPVTRSLSAGQRQILIRYVEFLDELPKFSDTQSQPKGRP